MNTPLQAGQALSSGFTILAVEALDELDALGIWARHQSGAEVFHLLNGDKENLFAFGFATAPEDSTGAAHVLEHSVLCGSEKYPLKDAFLILAQGSLQTFLNAMTYPDKTLYPAASIHERDYFNLMAVYGDAVFRPLLPEWVFLQEGRRFVLAEDALSISGVVYNEMKGVYSSPDAYAHCWSIRGVLPDTPYAYESGGSPEHIPDLSWDALREFHRKRYAPRNCRVFLAGNIPTEKQLAFLNEKVLAGLPPGEAAAAVPKAGRWRAPRYIAVPCPAAGEPKSTVLLSWLCADSIDTAETIALAALTETLLGHDGSPLYRALIESGLGEDLSPASGMEGDLRETVISVGLRGTPGRGEAAARKVEALVLGELERLVREGIPGTEIEAALLSMEFSHREIVRSQGPYSLVWLQRSFRGWLHGLKPWESLLFTPPFAQLKGRLGENPRYFESLIQKYLLGNPHRALIALEGDAAFLEEREAALAEKLAARKAALSGEEQRRIHAEAAELERMQNTPDSPEALAAIPHLSRKDLSPVLDPSPRELHDAGGIPAFIHPLFTNGITYGQFAFPVDILEPEDYPWLPLFTQAAVAVGLPGMDYAQVSSLLARTVGGFSAFLETGSPVEGAALSLPLPGGVFDLVGRDWLIYRLKALDEKAEAALDLARRMIGEADFSSQRRIRDLVVEMKNSLDASFAPMGHSYAAGRAGRRFSRAQTVEELWSGIAQIQFVHTLAGYDTLQICRKLEAIRDRLCSGGCLANLTGDKKALVKNLSCLERTWGSFGPPKPRNPAVQDAAALLPEAEPLPEVYAAPSLQIGFAALALPGASYSSREHAAELVLSHQLTTGALWEDIRMKGGAYGAFASADGCEGVFTLATYRDPQPLRSLDAFTRILQNRAAQEPDAAALEKAVIGAFAKETKPRTAASEGFVDFIRCLYGIGDQRRERKLQAMIASQEPELQAAARRLAAAQRDAPVIIAGPAAAREAAGQLGVEPKELPL
ncbi:MAG: insulinase family protein [Treponema sp.]|jgi:Zn-dependent M16 (insulinase) family peptidase|nr:insulinase family protein [Treponema sp.]